MFDTYQHYFPATFFASQAELFYTWLRHLYVSINSINVTLLTCRRWCVLSKRKYIPAISLLSFTQRSKLLTWNMRDIQNTSYITMCPVSDWSWQFSCVMTEVFVKSTRKIGHMVS